jgi:hypothetical protein
LVEKKKDVLSSDKLKDVVDKFFFWEMGPLSYRLLIDKSINRELNRRLTYECRCDERQRVKAEGSTHLTYTGLCGGLEHLKIETRLIDERFSSVMGECVILTPQVHRRH